MAGGDRHADGDAQPSGSWARFFHYLDLGMYPLLLLAKWGFAWVVVSFYVDFIPEPGVLRGVHQYPEVTVVILSFMIFLTAGDAARYHKQEAWAND